MSPNIKMLQRTIPWKGKDRKRRNPHSLVSKADTYREAGKADIAESLERLAKRKQLVYEQLNGTREAVDNGNELPHSVVTIFKRGMLTTLAMLGLVVFSGLFSLTVATALLILTAAVVQMVAYALWVELRVEVLNPVVLQYAILFTIALAGLVLSSLIFV